MGVKYDANSSFSATLTPGDKGAGDFPQANSKTPEGKGAHEDTSCNEAVAVPPVTQGAESHQPIAAEPNWKYQSIVKHPFEL